MTNFNMSHIETLVHAALQQQEGEDTIVFELIQEKQRILEAVERCADEKEVMYYVRNRQYQLVRLIDITDNEHIFRALDELLYFLRRDFERYMDNDCKAPDSYLIIAREAFTEEIAAVNQGIMNVEQELAAILMKPFHAFLREGEAFSYYETDYLTRLMEELLPLAEMSISEEDLHILLLEFDFNDPAYFKYLIETIRESIDDKMSIKAKKERVLLLQKDFNQIIVHPDMHLRKQHKTLKELLQSWLSAELEYLEKYETLLPSGELDIWKDFKVETTLSVPQLGRLIGLLMQTGIILNTNKTTLANFFAAFFSSIQSDEVNKDYIRNSFYDKSIGLAKSLRDILVKLINQSRK
jgi:hypothetical protein